MSKFLENDNPRPSLANNQSHFWPIVAHRGPISTPQDYYYVLISPNGIIHRVSEKK